MRAAYRGLANAISLGVVMQAGWIALSFFGVLSDVDHGTPTDGDNIGTHLHAGFGNALLPLLAIALLLVSLRAGVPGGTRWAALVLGVIAGQVALAYLAESWTPIGVLHGFGAFAVIAVAEAAARRTALDHSLAPPIDAPEGTTR